MILAMQDIIHNKQSLRRIEKEKERKDIICQIVKFWPRTPLILWALAHELILISPFSLK